MRDFEASMGACWSKRIKAESPFHTGILAYILPAFIFMCVCV